eukprot:2428437-Amphidinium_carterae.1
MRFPAVGLSIAGGSMKARGDVVNELHADQNKSRPNDIFELFASDDGKGFLEAMSKMNTGGDARTPAKKEICKSLEVITKFVDTHAKRMEKDMGLMAIMASRLYHMAMASLELTATLHDVNTWANNVPDATMEHEALQKLGKKTST